MVQAWKCKVFVRLIFNGELFGYTETLSHGFVGMFFTEVAEYVGKRVRVITILARRND